MQSRLKFPLIGGFIVCFMMAFLISGCHHKPSGKSKQQVMEEKVQERLDYWKADMVKKCVREVEERAVAIVDSTIIANAKANRDTAGIPLIPGRPAKPEFKPPADTIPVKPFLAPGKDTIGKGE
jgi:hypothetical protein